MIAEDKRVETGGGGGGVSDAGQLTWWLSSSPGDQRRRKASPLQPPAGFASQWSVEDKDGGERFVLAGVQITCMEPQC